MADSPGQAVSAYGVAGGGAVPLLEAVEEGTVQTGLAFLQAAVLFEATGSAGHTLGILPIAKATFLWGLTEDISLPRKGRAKESHAKEKCQCGLTGAEIK